MVNNTAQLIWSGRIFFDTLEQLIDSAVFEIHFQTYIFTEDETGQQIANALIRAAQRGVKIFLLADAYGSNDLSESFAKKLKQEGISFRWFGPFFRKGKFHIGRRLHRKVIVIDGETSVVTGINISNHYNDLAGKPAWLDFAVVVQGEVSEKLQSICKQSWLRIRFRRWSGKLRNVTKQNFFKSERTVKIRVRQNDWKSGKKQAAISYYQLIKDAEESLIIVGGYFLPGRKVRRLLRRASERGVVIKLVVAERSDVGMMKNAMLYLYDWLLRNKIHIYEYMPSNVHGKCIVADKKRISVGSHDVNALSTYSNIELNLDIDDKLIATQFHNQLEEVAEKECIEITADLLRMKRNISIRFLRWLSYRVVKTFFVLSVWLSKKERGEGYQ